MARIFSFGLTTKAKDEKMYETLHCHTTSSDGELNHLQLLDACKLHKISVVAFTDHDTLPGKKIVDQLWRNRNYSTKWIIGCELSSGWPKEIGGIGTNFHIIGLFVDPFNKKLLERNKKFNEGRIERMQKMVKNLKGLGFTISADECLKESAGESVQRPHIVAALTKKEKNRELISKFKERMAKEAKNNPEIKIKYEKMIKEGESQIPYILLLEDDSYIPGIYVDFPYYTDLDETVNLIRNSCGVAILAHWTFTKRKIDAKKIEQLFRDNRLDGAETIFGIEVIERREEIKKDMQSMERITKKWKKLQGGGIDIHKRKQFDLFEKEELFAQKTIGLTKNMIKQGKIDPRFSSFQV